MRSRTKPVVELLLQIPRRLLYRSWYGVLRTLIDMRVDDGASMVIALWVLHHECQACIAVL